MNPIQSTPFTVKIKQFFTKYWMHIPILLLFIFMVWLGSQTYRDYGISWDEKYQFEIAKANYDYVVHHKPDLLTLRDRYYGPFFELGLYPYLRLFHYPDHIYMRHRVFFMVFCVGLVGFYFLAHRLFKKARWAFLATVFLTVSPRIYADAFYNSKDIPLMVTFIFAGLTLTYLMERLAKSGRWYSLAIFTGLHALATAASITSRILGIVLIPITGLVMLVVLLPRLKEWKKFVVAGLAYLAVTFGLVILFWPVLWHDPIGGLKAAFTEMSHYPWNGLNLYMGKLIPASANPWHYLPVWIGITTPLVVTAGYLVSHIRYMADTIRRVKEQNPFLLVYRDIIDHPDWVMVLAWLYAPVAAILILKSNLYDGWRQTFFIYPAIVLLAIFGWRSLVELSARLRWSKVMAPVLAAVIFLGCLEPVWFMVKNHPYQNVYFNELAGDPATLRTRFDMDYWGLSYKQAIDYLLDHDSTPVINVFIHNSPGKTYIRLMLPAKKAARLNVVTKESEATYLITNYRMHPEDFPYPDEWYSIDVRGAEIMAIYKIK
jgi:hypothetical protein